MHCKKNPKNSLETDGPKAIKHRSKQTNVSSGNCWKDESLLILAFNLLSTCYPKVTGRQVTSIVILVDVKTT